jgi:hypothetical protein
LAGKRRLAFWAFAAGNVLARGRVGAAVRAPPLTTGDVVEVEAARPA